MRLLAGVSRRGRNWQILGGNHERDEYERAYYTGILYERRAKAQLAHGTPGCGPRSYEWLREADRLGWHPRVLATGAAADGSLLAAPAAFEGKLFLALPSEPEHASAQGAALAAAEVLIEALKRAGRDLSREGLVDQLESLNAFATGHAPPLTFGPARRLGARGAYVVRVEGKALKGAGWVSAE